LKNIFKAALFYLNLKILFIFKSTHWVLSRNLLEKKVPQVSYVGEMESGRVWVEELELLLLPLVENLPVHIGIRNVAFV